jgi:ketosteroid isomerase-like protein
MKQTLVYAIGWLIWVCLAATACAQPAATPEQPAATSEDPAHTELRKVRDGLVKAVEERNIEGVLSYLHPNVVVIWQNGEVSRGHAGVREYYTRMLVGEKRIVESIKSNAKVADLALLYGGDTALAWGTLNDDFKLTDGMEFHLTSYWTATLVRENGRWVLASFHASNNVFDNSVLHLAVRKVSMWAGGIGAAVGAFVALLIALMLKRRRTVKA